MCFQSIVECVGFACKALKAERPWSRAKPPVLASKDVFFSNFLLREAHGGWVCGADFDLIGLPAEIDRDGESLAGGDKLHPRDAG